MGMYAVPIAAVLSVSSRARTLDTACSASGETVALVLHLAVPGNVSSSLGARLPSGVMLTPRLASRFRVTPSITFERRRPCGIVVSETFGPENLRSTACMPAQLGHNAPGRTCPALVVGRLRRVHRPAAGGQARQYLA